MSVFIYLLYAYISVYVCVYLMLHISLLLYKYYYKILKLVFLDINSKQD